MTRAQALRPFTADAIASLRLYFGVSGISVTVHLTLLPKRWLWPAFGGNEAAAGFLFQHLEEGGIATAAP